MYRTIQIAIAVSMFTTAMATAQSIVFIPEGSTDTVRMVKAETGETIKRITGLVAVHGLSGSPGVPYLVAGSYAQSDRAAIAEIVQPEGVSEDEHAVHHTQPTEGPIGPADAGISILSVLDAASGEILRRIEVPGAVHHTAVSPDGRFAVATHPSGDGISVIDMTTFKLSAFVTTAACRITHPSGLTPKSSMSQTPETARSARSILVVALSGATWWQALRPNTLS